MRGETIIGATSRRTRTIFPVSPVRPYNPKYGDKADLSRMDWMIATDMAKSGHWTQQEVEKGIREASPALESRKAGHNYAKRTAEKAWAAPEVQQHRQEQARQAQREGPSLW